jgi:hypothetical protein
MTSEKKLSLRKDDSGQAGNILGLMGILIGMGVLLALGGLIASQMTSASSLPAGDPYNVSTTTATYYPLSVQMGYIAIFAGLGMVVLGMVLGYFMYPGRGAR